jgi:ectoine hydroxylase-related dioxygenase (phytanoyl-CoA dioxygenase family)
VVQADATGTTLAKLRESFERDGYVVFDPQIPETTLDAANACTEPEFRTERRAEQILRRGKRALRGRDKDLSVRLPYRVQDAWTICEPVKQIATAPRVFALLRELYGREPLPFQTLNFRVGTQQPPHADSWHFSSDPPGYMCGVWVALEDVGPDQGPVVYYPGSHKLPELSFEYAGELSGNKDYERFLHEVIEEKGITPALATMKKGEAVVWASDVIHGGAPQRDMSLTRLSQVTHYFFEGCEFWRPIQSDLGTRHYFKPAFIPSQP